MSLLTPSPSPALAVLPVIMAGGSGTRLWPLSRAKFPKQFLAFGGTQTLFQQAVQRVAALAGPGVALAPSLVLGNEEHRFLLLDQLREISQHDATILLEPAGRNTAPAVTLAALQAVAGGSDPVMVVTPADQAVTDGAAFSLALRAAVARAASGAVVILGITPDRPETGFGYIQCSAAGQPGGASRVARFVEKPDLATAQGYLAAGGYFWNSGIFVMRASVWLAAIERLRPDIAEATRLAHAAHANDERFVRPDAKLFAAIPSESVDYAVLEKLVTGAAAQPVLCMVPLDAGWSDLGAWEAVWAMLPKDERGNASQGDAVIKDCDNTAVYATTRLVATVGLKDVVVVETADSVLVIDRQRSQEVRQVVAQLHADKREEQLLHRQVHRPWGWYDSVDSGARFQVKRIMVKPGASLSLQKHFHRAEHWIVVSGTAEVTRGQTTQLLTENQSTYIPLGEVHRLANPGLVPLEIIEVQSGSYLGEDDIVRLDDTYGRR